jgi:hypothetical protein
MPYFTKISQAVRISVGTCTALNDKKKLFQIILSLKSYQYTLTDYSVFTRP